MSENWSVDHTYITEGAWEDAVEADAMETRGQPCRVELDAEGLVSRLTFEERGAEGGVILDEWDLSETGTAGLRRSGVMSMNFSFIVGRNTRGLIDTPYGRMTVGVETTFLDIEKSPQKVSINLGYRLSEAVEELHRIKVCAYSDRTDLV